MWQFSDAEGLERSRFLLTHPVWDVTSGRVGCTDHTYDFYSHIPCGMWRRGNVECLCISKFLLTHPVWDVTMCGFSFSSADVFLLTHPVWDVTNDPETKTKKGENFYSHIPCGMWPYNWCATAFFWYFYSHIPCGMWLLLVWMEITVISISTHTSRVGCDGNGTNPIMST